MLIPNPLFFTHRGRLIELSTKTRLPLMGWSREFSTAGALLAYGANDTEMTRQAARYVARILHSAKPAELPVEQPTKFDGSFCLGSFPRAAESWSGTGIRPPPLRRRTSVGRWRSGGTSAAPTGGIEDSPEIERWRDVVGAC